MRLALRSLRRSARYDTFFVDPVGCTGLGEPQGALGGGYGDDITTLATSPSGQCCRFVNHLSGLNIVGETTVIEGPTTEG